MRTARDITFNEAELANNINIKNLFKITTPITTTTDDSDLIISEIIKVITQKSFQIYYTRKYYDATSRS